MKIRNTSRQDLQLTLQLKSGTGSFSLKPNQVMYCESDSQVNKQLVIYEKKKLISMEKETQKPDYVDYYKSFFEAGTYSPTKQKTVIQIDDEDDEEIIDIPEDSPLAFDVEDSTDSVESVSEEEAVGEPKKKRGRPRKPVVETEPAEKKQRGRPKGSTKNKDNQNNTSE